MVSYNQIRVPTPNIWCRPGWCLEYVNNAYDVAAVYPSATAAWEASTTKHHDRNFPAGVWTPVWYGLDTTPLGHVVLRAPDGSVYSTSDLTNTPHHHPDLADLEAYYAYYGMGLIYRGWTEDVEGTRVLAPTQSTPTQPKESSLSAAEVKAIKDHVNAVLIGGYTWNGKKHPGGLMVVEEEQRRAASDRAQLKGLVGAIAALSKGETFDEAKLLAGVQAAAEAGIKAGLENGVIDVSVTVAGPAAPVLEK